MVRDVPARDWLSIDLAHSVLHDDEIMLRAVFNGYENQSLVASTVNVSLKMSHGISPRRCVE